MSRVAVKRKRQVIPEVGEVAKFPPDWIGLSKYSNL